MPQRSQPRERMVLDGCHARTLRAARYAPNARAVAGRTLRKAEATRRATTSTRCPVLESMNAVRYVVAKFELTDSTCVQPNPDDLAQRELLLGLVAAPNNTSSTRRYCLPFEERPRRLLVRDAFHISNAARSLASVKLTGRSAPRNHSRLGLTRLPSLRAERAHSPTRLCGDRCCATSLFAGGVSPKAAFPRVSQGETSGSHDQYRFEAIRALLPALGFACAMARGQFARRRPPGRESPGPPSASWRSRIPPSGKAWVAGGSE